MTNSYAFWRDSLAGKNPDGHIDHPQPGFYRMKRGAVWVPVAVWPAGHGLGFKIGSEVVGNQTGVDKWPWYSHHPISEKDYRAVAERGEPWPDEDPTVSALLDGAATELIRKADLAAIAKNIANEPPLAEPKKPADPTDEYREQINTALAGVKIYEKIESDEASARATGLRNMLMDLAGAADKARISAKAPYLAKEREIDGQWQPMIKEAQEAAKNIRLANNAWEDTKRAAAAEAAKRAQEVLAEQMRERAEDVESDQMAPIDAPLPQSNLPPPSAKIVPTYGRKAHVGTKLVVTELDAVKFITALKPRAEWPEVFELLMEVAQKMANRGIVIDGVMVTEKANTR